jgi:hypothetical protein
MQLLVVAFWIAAMTWLAWSKVLPHANNSAVPDQRLVASEALGPPRDVVWNMFWDGRSIGTARMSFAFEEDGISTVQSVVQCRRLPVSEMAEELIGNWAVFAGIAKLGQKDTFVSFDLSSEMLFDVDGKLSRFRSSVDYAGVGELFILRGFQFDDKIDVAVTAGELMTTADGTSQELFRRTFPIPPDAFVIDAFAPSPRLANLRLGQEWTFKTFRPFPPNSPLRTAHAVVDGRDMLAWGDDVETVYVVTFTETDSGLTSVNKPFSKLWVQDDGTVLKQELLLANLKVEFRRQSDDDFAAEAKR